jgi:hypothetical protein
MVERYDEAFRLLDEAGKLHLAMGDPVELELHMLHRHARQLIWNASENLPSDAGKAVWLLDLAIKRNASHFASVLWQANDEVPAVASTDLPLKGEALLLAIMRSRKEAIRLWLEESLERKDFQETVRRIHAATDRSILAEIAWNNVASRNPNVQYASASINDTTAHAEAEKHEKTPVQQMLGETYRLWVLDLLESDQIIEAMEVVKQARKEKVLEGILPLYLPPELL